MLRKVNTSSQRARYIEEPGMDVWEAFVKNGRPHFAFPEVCVCHVSIGGSFLGVMQISDWEFGAEEKVLQSVASLERQHGSSVSSVLFYCNTTPSEKSAPLFLSFLKERQKLGNTPQIALWCSALRTTSYGTLEKEPVMKLVSNGILVSVFTSEDWKTVHGSICGPQGFCYSFEMKEWDEYWGNKLQELMLNANQGMETFNKKEETASGGKQPYSTTTGYPKAVSQSRQQVPAPGQQNLNQVSSSQQQSANVTSRNPVTAKIGAVFSNVTKQLQMFYDSPFPSKSPEESVSEEGSDTTSRHNEFLVNRTYKFHDVQNSSEYEEHRREKLSYDFNNPLTFQHTSTGSDKKLPALESEERLVADLRMCENVPEERSRTGYQNEELESPLVDLQMCENVPEETSLSRIGYQNEELDSPLVDIQMCDNAPEEQSRSRTRYQNEELESLLVDLQMCENVLEERSKSRTDYQTAAVPNDGLFNGSQHSEKISTNADPVLVELSTGLTATFDLLDLQHSNKQQSSNKQAPQTDCCDNSKLSTEANVDLETDKSDIKAQPQNVCDGLTENTTNVNNNVASHFEESHLNSDNDTTVHKEKRTFSDNDIFSKHHSLLDNSGANVDHPAALTANQSPLVVAILQRNVAQVDRQLENGADVNQRDRNIFQETPLLVATELGFQDEVATLLRHGATTEMRDAFGQSPLCIAVLGRHYGVAEELLKSGARVDFPNSFGNTPLHLSSRAGDILMCELLLRYTPTLNIFNDFNDTPLDLALEASRDNLAQVLREYGCKTNSELVKKPKKSVSPSRHTFLIH